MMQAINKLLELRKEYPFVAFFAIIGLIVVLVISILAAANGLYVPLIIGVFLLIIGAMILLIFSRFMNAQRGSFWYYLFAVLSGFLVLLIMAWGVILTLGVLCVYPLPFLNFECPGISHKQTKTHIRGYIEPRYITETLVERPPETFEVYAEECEPQIQDNVRACIPVGASLKSAAVENAWINRNAGSISPVRVEIGNTGQNCYVVEWKAESGINEDGSCRFPAGISGQLVVKYANSGAFIGPKHRFDEVTEATSFITEYMLDVERPTQENTKIVGTKWEFSALVETFSKALSKETSMVINHSDPNAGADDCVKGQMQSNTLIVTFDC
ncbi:MAG: hypothetical protein AAF198_07910 [Pseudomonadota bacterium]